MSKWRLSYYAGRLTLVSTLCICHWVLDGLSYVLLWRSLLPGLYPWGDRFFSLQTSLKIGKHVSLLHSSLRRGFIYIMHMIYLNNIKCQIAFTVTWLTRNAWQRCHIAFIVTWLTRNAWQRCHYCYRLYTGTKRLFYVGLDMPHMQNPQCLWKVWRIVP